MITIGIIEADNYRREVLKEQVNAQEELVCLNAAKSVTEFLALPKPTPTLFVILLGLVKIDSNAELIAGLEAIKKHFVNAAIIVLAEEEKSLVVRALKGGVAGFLAKDVGTRSLKDAILNVAGGGACLSPVAVQLVAEYFRENYRKPDYDLTTREKEIMRCLVNGLSYKLIAVEVQLSVDTVRYHLRNIYKKLAVNSKAQVIVKALQENIAG